MKIALFLIPALIGLSALQMRCTHAQANVALHNPYRHRITIKVHDVPAATDTLTAQPYREVLHQKYVENVLMTAEMMHTDEGKPYKAPKRYLECFSRDRRPLTGASNNGFLETVHRAYAQHHPLVITPDMIWLTIVQGFAQHVNHNSEAMRAHFVRHSGQKPLVVDMTGRANLGDDKSDWEWAFRQFQDSIAANTNGDIARTIAGRFSGTDSDAAVAFDIALMESMKAYFGYFADISCGIPEITLEGSPEDWQQIEQRAAKLARYDLDWWLRDLQPMLAEFTRTAQGRGNREFWAGILRDLHEAGCGAISDTFITGWIVKLFPYVKQDGAWRRNPLIGLKSTDLYTIISDAKPSSNMKKRGQYTLCTDTQHWQVLYTGPKVTFADIPSGVCEVVLHINNYGNMHKMELKAGFFGVRHDPDTRALRPVIGWAIVDTGEKPDQEAVKQRTKKF
jgi:Domain of unknown function (DUF4419)